MAEGVLLLRAISNLNKLLKKKIKNQIKAYL